MELTKKDLELILDRKLSEQTKDLKTFSRGQTEELARMVKTGFDDVIDRLDVRERVQKLEKQMTEMRTALRLS